MTEQKGWVVCTPFARLGVRGVPITASQVGNTGELCEAYVWEIADRPRLVQLVAHAAMGRYLTIAKAVRALNVSIPDGAYPSAADAAVAKLTVKPREHPWHRDGWLFQLIAWVAAHQGLAEEDIVRAPQPRKADKGFDGIVVILREQASRPRGVVICEQKATGHPKKKLTSKVFPEFASLESGGRDDELFSEVTSLLSQLGDSEVAIELAEKLLWKSERQYQAAVTVETPHPAREQVTSLFAGYDECVKGGTFRRRAETIVISPLRKWFDEFAGEVIHEIRRLKG